MPGVSYMPKSTSTFAIPFTTNLLKYIASRKNKHYCKEQYRQFLDESFAIAFYLLFSVNSPMCIQILNWIVSPLQKVIFSHKDTFHKTTHKQPRYLQARRNNANVCSLIFKVPAYLPDRSIKKSDLLMPLFRLRRFKDQRHIVETRVVHDSDKHFCTKTPLPYQLMAVNP